MVVTDVTMVVTDVVTDVVSEVVTDVTEVVTAAGEGREEGNDLSGFLQAYQCETSISRIEKRRSRGRKTARSMAQRAKPKSNRVHQINFRASHRIQEIFERLMTRWDMTKAEVLERMLDEIAQREKLEVAP